MVHSQYTTLCSSCPSRVRHPGKTESTELRWFLQYIITISELIQSSILSWWVGYSLRSGNNCYGHRCMKKWTKAQCGKYSWFINRTEHCLTKRPNKTETVLSGADTKTENNYPQNTGGKSLPKYGSQTKTTIDSCLWLRTTPGQTHRNRKHRMPTPTHALTKPK